MITMNITKKTLLAGIMLPLVLSIGTLASAAPKQCRDHNDALEQDAGIREIASLPLLTI